MKSHSLILVLAVLVIAVVGASLPTDYDCVSEIGCELANKRDSESPTRTVRRSTNAELLRRGLPLKYPVLRRGTFVYWWNIRYSLLIR
jgi:hypothetical protein